MLPSPDEMPAAAQRPLLDFIEEELRLGGWFFDLAASRTYWSGNLYSLFGLDPVRVSPGAEIFRQIVHPEDRPELDSAQVDAFGGPLGEYQFRIIRPNGTIRWIQSMGRLLHRSDGTPWRVVGCVRDVTEDRDAVVARAAHDGLAQAVRKLTGGDVWLTSPKGDVGDALPWNGHHGGLRFDAIHADDLTRVRSGWAKSLAERRPFRSAYRQSTGQGRYEAFSTYAEPIEDDRRVLLGWIGVSVPDLTTDAHIAPARNIPGSLLRAARAWLDLSVMGLADRSGLSSSTIRRLEGGGGRQATRSSEEALVRTFREAGIDFYLDAGGQPQVRFPGDAEVERPRLQAVG